VRRGAVLARPFVALWCVAAVSGCSGGAATSRADAVLACAQASALFERETNPRAGQDRSTGSRTPGTAAARGAGVEPDTRPPSAATLRARTVDVQVSALRSGDRQLIALAEELRELDDRTAMLQQQARIRERCIALGIG
jgi:hypothetical protein